MSQILQLLYSYFIVIPAVLRLYTVETNCLVVRPHIFLNSIGQERDRFIIPRLLPNRIVELYEDKPQKLYVHQICMHV